MAVTATKVSASPATAPRFIQIRLRALASVSWSIGWSPGPPSLGPLDLPTRAHTRLFLRCRGVTRLHSLVRCVTAKETMLDTPGWVPERPRAQSHLRGDPHELPYPRPRLRARAACFRARRPYVPGDRSGRVLDRRLDHREEGQRELGDRPRRRQDGREGRRQGHDHVHDDGEEGRGEAGLGRDEEGEEVAAVLQART